jgi:hypothetical protein
MQVQSAVPGGASQLTWSSCGRFGRRCRVKGRLSRSSAHSTLTRRRARASTAWTCPSLPTFALVVVPRQAGTLRADQRREIADPQQDPVVALGSAQGAAAAARIHGTANPAEAARWLALAELARSRRPPGTRPPAAPDARQAGEDLGLRVPTQPGGQTSSRSSMRWSRSNTWRANSPTILAGRSSAGSRTVCCSAAASAVGANAGALRTPRSRHQPVSCSTPARRTALGSASR